MLFCLKKKLAEIFKHLSWKICKPILFQCCPFLNIFQESGVLGSIEIERRPLLRSWLKLTFKVLRLKINYSHLHNSNDRI